MTNIWKDNGWRFVTIYILINLNKFSTQQKTRKWKLNTLEHGQAATIIKLCDKRIHLFMVAQ